MIGLYNCKTIQQPAAIPSSLWLCSRSTGAHRGCGMGGQPRTGTQPWTDLPPALSSSGLPGPQMSLSASQTSSPYCMFSGSMLLTYFAVSSFWKRENGNEVRLRRMSDHDRSSRRQRKRPVRSEYCPQNYSSKKRQKNTLPRLLCELTARGECRVHNHQSQPIRGGVRRVLWELRMEP